MFGKFDTNFQPINIVSFSYRIFIKQTIILIILNNFQFCRQNGKNKNKYELSTFKYTRMARYINSRLRQSQNYLDFSMIIRARSLNNFSGAPDQGEPNFSKS